MSLEGKTAAVLVEDIYEDLELWYPVYRLREAGADVVLVGPESGKTYEWVDEQVVCDGNLITSRTPADLPAFLRSILASLAQASLATC